MSGPRLAILPARAVSDRRLSRADLCVLAAFGINANTKTDRCHVSQATIAEWLGITQRTVRRHVAKLKRLGYLEVVPRRHPGGYMRCAEYRIAYDSKLPIEQPRQPTRTEDVVSDHRTPQALRSASDHRTPQALSPQDTSGPIYALRENARSPSVVSEDSEPTDGASAPSGDSHGSEKKKTSKGAEERTEDSAAAGDVAARPRHMDVPGYLFRDGLAYLVDSGRPERAARSVIGKWRRSKIGDGTLLEIMQRAQDKRVEDPVEYIEAAVRQELRKRERARSHVGVL